MSATSYVRPKDLAECFMLLNEHSSIAQPVAGGSSLSLRKSNRPTLLIELRGLELDGLKRKGTDFELGAMASCTELLDFLKKQQSTQNALYDSLLLLANPTLRNHITLGGNCLMVYAWSDLPVAFLTLKANFAVSGPQTRKIAAHDFFLNHPKKIVANNELLTSIQFVLPEAKTGSAFCKFSSVAGGQAIASAAARVTIDQGIIKEANITVGAVSALPQSLKHSANLLLGKKWEPTLISQFEASVLQEVKITHDYRVQEDYRRDLAKTLATDALQKARKRTGE